jgi:UDP-N-acetyl-D-mannosaminuronic acid dehydrogenase
LTKKICVLGLGYIGLPTASILANNGFEVLGVDINDEIIKKLNSGELHIEEPELKGIFLNAFESKHLKISKNPTKSDVFIISVPTPLTKENKAELKYVIDAADSIKEFLEKDNLVILESTSPPGTTEHIVGRILEKYSGLKAGKDFSLAFCPERVLPGKIIHELVNNDRIIGGFDTKSSEKAEEIYKSFVRGSIFTSDLKTAEIVKLVENTYRDVNLAFANELTLICESYNINVWDVIKYANMHPRVNILNPGPGVGGHCIPIDPWFVIENIDYPNSLIEKCRGINDMMPLIIKEKIIQITAGIKNPNVTLLGVSYKENIGDTRESPSNVIYRGLLEKGVNAYAYDPIAENSKIMLSSFEKSFRDSDLLVLLVAHNCYKKLDFKQISKLMRTKNIFDCRNFFDKNNLKEFGFTYFGI